MKLFGINFGIGGGGGPPKGGPPVPSHTDPDGTRHVANQDGSVTVTKPDGTLVGTGMPGPRGGAGGGNFQAAEALYSAGQDAKNFSQLQWDRQMQGLAAAQAQMAPSQSLYDRIYGTNTQRGPATPQGVGPAGVAGPPRAVNSMPVSNRQPDVRQQLIDMYAQRTPQAQPGMPAPAMRPMMQQPPQITSQPMHSSMPGGTVGGNPFAQQAPTGYMNYLNSMMQRR